MAKLRIEEAMAVGHAATRRPSKAMRLPASAFRQRGAALLIALIALIAMALAGASMMRSTDTSTLMAGNLSFTASALHANDVGIEAAAARLQTLVDADTLSSPSDNYYEDFVSTSAVPASSRLSSSTPNPITVNGNTLYYIVERMCNPYPTKCVTRDGLPLYRMSVDVAGPRNTRITTQAMVNAFAEFDPDAAIITDGDLKISGNPEFPGSIAKVHTNGYIDISGNGGSDALDEATAVGSTIACNNATCTDGITPAYIPDISPSDFFSYSDYRMKADGIVYDENDNFVFDTSGGSEWNGWKRDITSPVRWICCNGVTPPNAMYYIEGNLNIGSNPGTSSVPWAVTLLAEGHIEVGGNPYFADHKDTFDPVAVQNLFVVAGTDLKFNGNATHTIEGIMVAGEQLGISGNPALDGFIVVQDKLPGDFACVCADGLLLENDLSGNFSLTYSGGLDNPWDGDGVVRENWRIVQR